MKNNKLENCYDEVPYPSYPYSQTHPDHLATVATLLGLAPPKRPYRVLELGCAAGGNLIPMALTRPDVVMVAPVDRRILSLLDGSRGAAQITDELLSQYLLGDLEIRNQDDTLISDAESVRSILKQLIPERLQHFLRCSLLEVLSVKSLLQPMNRYSASFATV